MIGVLIVDDNSDIRLLIRVLIEAANRDLFVSGEAAGGQEALEAIDALDPTVIVLDHMMPEMSGTEVAREIRKKRPNQPMIMCSAYLNGDVLREAEAAGIGVCLSKEEMHLVPQTARDAVSSN